MDFALLIVVLLTYFIRPQDWVPGMSGLNIMNLVMVFALVAMLFRKGGFNVASILRTPLDWAMLAYGGFIIWAAPSGQKPFVPVAVFLAFYVVTSQALSTPERLNTYLRWWLYSLLAVAGMAVASEYGLDLTGAKDLTHAVPEIPRLVLNTYLFNNANALGHSVIATIPLAYLLLFWKKPVRLRLIAIAAVALAITCVIMTKSKGAFIIGFAVMVAALLIGRPKLFQIIILLIAATLGVEGLRQMPRMTDMANVREDEAVMGRMLAWEQARIVSKNEPNGEGFKNFQAIIEWEKEEIFKATHSSYVLIGAELGTRGMLFYLAVLYASLRTLATTRCRSEEDEGSRRALMVILLCYLGSSWLIDRSYHLEYFFLAGAVSAFHRRLGEENGIFRPAGNDTAHDTRNEDRNHPDPEAFTPATGISRFSSITGEGGAADGGVIRRPSDIDMSEAVAEAIEDEKFRFWFWRRWGVLDLLMVVLFSKVIFTIWDRLLETFFH